ncbi:phosphonate metabolism-associated iron-containing alcohol dehydrogenase [Desulfuromusa kysingii]|uniref:Phosphonate metabolism-associated iron-containing alcohol dehydrogenase n=1 Tax=Desulfuromusa kysingii TaxID=37625 RepID=A0A1H4CY22_9BACT|nr:phosphonoacetaldehyde reductase [Desulfuromusa kysingii]SEA65012.1 phosphonate metabolism-associated iron-containing alcohol dehydrogenase [Desulfuromusa kysingii]
MKDSFAYHMPTKIVYGINSICDIDQYINGRKTLLVTSRGALSRGLVAQILSLTCAVIHVVSDINSHPEFVDLEKNYNSLNNVDFELILAVGGGSVLDAAKFISVYSSEKNSTFVTKLTKGVIPHQEYHLKPIISVPTTAGTGSEITPWATIWDMDERKKYSLHLPELFSEMAIYDPALTLTSPENITIQTGLDTISHALESIWNKNASPITVDYAIKAARLVLEYLPKLVNDLDEIHYRDKLMQACMYSGLAFSNTQTALAHAISYHVTANKGVDHGIACSFTLPLLIDNVIGRYEFIDNALEEIFGELSSQKMRNLLSSLNISTKFSDYKIDDDELCKIKLLLENNQRASNSLVSL